MKLNKMKLEDLELLSHTKIAELYLKENKTTMNTAELFNKICELLKLDDADQEDQIVDFFQSLTTSKDFILLSDGKWDLKSNHSVKMDIDEIYEEKEDDEAEEETDIEEELEEDFDTVVSEDDDYDDELAELTIIEEDEENEN